MTIDLRTIEVALARELTVDEKALVETLEDAGLVVSEAPPADPEPTEAETIMAAPDCEYIEDKPEKDNPFGCVRSRTYRSKELGREVVYTYDFKVRLRDGEPVTEDAVVEYVEVRDLPVEIALPVEVIRR